MDGQQRGRRAVRCRVARLVVLADRRYREIVVGDMDVRQVFADSAVKEEFLDRFDELAEQAKPVAGELEGLDSLDGVPSLDEAATVADEISEGTFQPGTHHGLEAIIERFTRPVHLVQESTFTVPPDSFPNSGEIRSHLEGARVALERVIPSAGRIDLRNHRLDWAGTAWMVAPDVVVTNRHVAREFASEKDGVFMFRQNFGAPPVRASIDWRHEHGQPDELRFRVTEVLWIEPEDSVDVALLRIADQGEDGEEQPPAIDLMSRAEFQETGVGSWVAVIGYPAFDSRNNIADQQRIFDGIYNVKRLAPGQVTAIAAQDVLHHDATTLGGNSGSVVVDLASGKAAALHFGGIEGHRNLAVQAPRVHQMLVRFLA
jgi:V8-like Glu-specific endopeptidase